MNLVGKIFVILILIMSLVFMTTAIVVYSTHKNWREAAKSLKADLTKKQNEYNELNSKQIALIEETQSEQARLKADLAKLDVQRSELNKEYTRLVNDNAKIVEQSRQAVAAMEAAQKTLADMRTQIAALRTEIHATQQERDEQFKLAVKLTDDLNQAQSQLNTFKAQNAELVAQKAQLTKLLDTNGINPNASPDGPPKVDGYVLASSKDGLVEISLGTDDGIEKGHKLEVYRGGKYLGRIEVWQAAPDKSVAKVIPEFRKGPIAKEDRVATRLN